MPFQNNMTLRAANEQVEMEPWMLKELVKCAKDPVYFANTYVKITTKDDGIQLFKTWDFQADLINTIRDNRFTVTKFPRQCGKCVYYDMLIYVKFNDGTETEMTIGDLFELIKEIETMKGNSKDYLLG